MRSFPDPIRSAGRAVGGGEGKRKRKWKGKRKRKWWLKDGETGRDPPRVCGAVLRGCSLDGAGVASATLLSPFTKSIAVLSG